MERRDFLKRIGVTGAVTATVGALGFALHDRRSGAAFFRDAGTDKAAALPSFRVHRDAGAVQVAVARGANPERLVQAALGMLGGLSAFVRPGETVLLKPNVAFDRPPELGATTNPVVLRAVVQCCRDAGAAQVLVTDNPINQPEGCFYKTGIKQAAEEAGARIVLPRPSAFARVRINGEVLDTWPLLQKPFLAADKVIGIAPCKDHNLCSASMGMKNWYGLLGGRRNQFHQKIHGVIADFPLMIQPTLVVLDGSRLLMRNGPTGGSLADVKRGDTMVVGTDMVAVDTIGYGLLGRDAAQLDYLHRAEARGLGTTRWRDLPYREEQVG